MLNLLKSLFFIFFISISYSKSLYIKGLGKIKVCKLKNNEVIKIYNQTITLKDLKPYINLAKTLNEKDIKVVLSGAILDKLVEKNIKNNKEIDIAYYLFEKTSPQIALNYLSKKSKILKKGNVCKILYNITLNNLENAKVTLDNIDKILSNPIKYCKKANLSLDDCEKQVEVLKKLKLNIENSIKPSLFRYKTLISKIYVPKRTYLKTLYNLFKNSDLNTLKSLVATYRIYNVPLYLLRYKNGKLVDLLTNKTLDEKRVLRGYVIYGYRYPIKFYKIKNYLKRKQKPFVILENITYDSKLTFDVCSLIALKKINRYAFKLLREAKNNICVDLNKLEILKKDLAN